MKICQSHWDSLRKGIEERGLSHLVARNGEEVAGIVERSLNGTHHPTQDFDPLLLANYAIWKNALEVGGMYLLSPDENGESYCPLCECDKHGGSSESWMGYACDDALTEARRLGLVPGVQ